jgi:hypothetical protein
VGISRDYPLKTRTSKQLIGKVPGYKIIPSHPLEYPRSKQGLSMLKHLTMVITREQKQRLEVIYIFKQIYTKYKHSLVIDTVMCKPLVASITTRKTDVRGPCAAHNMHSQQRGMKSTLSCYKNINK